MVRLNEDYYIDVDSYNYTLKKDYKKVYTDKNGAERKAADVIGYYPTFYKALLGAREHFLRESLSDGEKCLSEALKVVEKANKKFEDMMYGALEQKGKK